MNRLYAGCLAVFVSFLLAVAVADAASVAYLDKGGVWVSSLDGKKKRKVSGKTRDRRVWTELTQSDNGRIMAVRRQPGKIAPLNSFRLWGPTGKRIFDGMLTAESGWTSHAFPLSLDLTPNGRNVVYGYSVSSYGFPVGRFERGTYIIYADRFPASQPFKIADQGWPTTVGNRLVTAEVPGSSSPTVVDVQQATGQPPFSNEFAPWIDVGATGYELQRTDVSANRKLAAVEGVKWDGGTVAASAVLMVKINGLGGNIADSCQLPAKGQPGDVSISQDGRSVAWHDRRGVVVAGAPTFSGDTCSLRRRAVVISKTAKQPSIGNARVTVKKKRKRR